MGELHRRVAVAQREDGQHVERDAEHDLTKETEQLTL